MTRCSIPSATSMLGFLAHDIAQRSYDFDRSPNHIAGRQETARAVAGASRRSREQNVAALEARTLIDESYQLRHIPGHLGGRSVLTYLAVHFQGHVQLRTRRRKLFARN